MSYAGVNSGAGPGGILPLGTAGTKSGTLAAQANLAGAQAGAATMNAETARNQQLIDLMQMTGTQTQTGTSATETTFSDPGKAAQLIDLVSGAIGSGAQNLQNLGDFTSSNTYQDALRGIMEGMRFETEQGMSDLADAARIAGGSAGLRSGAYGASLGNFLAGRQRAGFEAAGKLVGELFPAYAGAQTAAFNQAAPLLNAMKGEKTTTMQESKLENPQANDYLKNLLKEHQFLGGGFGIKA